MDAKIGICLFDMLKNTLMTDITIVVQGTEVKAHRVVVGSRGGLLRKLLGDEKRVRFELKEDISVDTFRTVLEFIYTDDCNIGDKNLFQVMHAAKVLNLGHLEKLCGDLVQPKMTIANLGTFTSHALGLGAREIVKACQEFFRSYTSDVIKTQEFMDISHEALVALCSSDGISCSEVDMFRACIKWAKRECQQRRQQEATPQNLRTALGDVLMKIRFPAMAREDFAKKVAPLDILTYEEIGRLYMQWETKKELTHFKGEMRTDVQKPKPRRIEVIVNDFRKYNQCARANLPISTRIMEIKELVLFKGTRYNRSLVNSFTLSHDGTVLNNGDALESLYTSRSPVTQALPLFLDIHSYDLNVRIPDYQPSPLGKVSTIRFPVTVNTREMSDFERVVRGNVYIRTGWPTDKGRIVYRGDNGAQIEVTIAVLHPGFELIYLK